MKFISISLKTAFGSIKWALYGLLGFFGLIAIGGLIIYHTIDLKKLKNDVLLAIEEKSDLRIEYVNNQLIFFPSPGIEFDYINVYFEEEKIAELNRMSIEFSIWELLNGNFDINAVELHSGKLYLLRNKKGDLEFLSGILKDSNDTPESKVELTPEGLFKILPESTRLDNIHVDFVDDFYNRRHTFYIWNSQLSVSSFTRSQKLDLYGKVNDKKIEIYSDLHWEEDEFSYKSLRTKSTFLLEEFNLSLIDDILVIFPNADFKESLISGRFFLLKENDDFSKLQVKDAIIRKFAFPKSKPFGNIQINTWITYSWKEHRLGFDDIIVFWKNRASLSGSGYLTFDAKPLIYFRAKSDFVDLNHVYKVVRLWTDADLEKSVLFRGMPDSGYAKKYSLTLDLNLWNVFYDENRIPHLYTKFSYKYPKIIFSFLNMKLDEGELESNGEVLLFSGEPKISFSGKLKDFQVESLIAKRTNTKYITGILNSTFNLFSSGDTEEKIYENLNIKGDYNLHEGELIGYLNFLRPVASLGKIINFMGPPGNSLAYDSIKGNFTYRNRIITFPLMKMKGIGLDAEGSGKADLDGRMDIRLTVSLSGVAGKMIKLPIIYKGFFGRNLPYVDPIWLGSVYAGTFILPGPAGAAVGGIAGSAASDYINKAVGKIKSLFWFSSSEDEE